MAHSRNNDAERMLETSETSVQAGAGLANPSAVAHAVMQAELANVAPLGHGGMGDDELAHCKCV